MFQIQTAVARHGVLGKERVQFRRQPRNHGLQRRVIVAVQGFPRILQES